MALSKYKSPFIHWLFILCLCLSNQVLRADADSNTTHSVNYEKEGLASWYADKYHGHPTASGELYSKYKLTAAHPTLPFGSHVRVTHLRTQHSVVVTINDRGRFRQGRIIDLSRKAAEELEMLSEGIAPVQLELLQEVE